MNKNILIGLVVLLALGGGAYLMQSKQTTSPGSQTQNQAMGEAAEFAQAIESGRPTTCTMTRGEDVMEYHLKGKMMVANITTTLEGKTTLSHMINDGEYFYTWTDDSSTGTKMSLALPTPSIPSSPDSLESTPEFSSADDYDQLKAEGYTINCESGNFADSIFTPPSNIEFIDPSEFVNSMPPLTDEGVYDMTQFQQLKQQYEGFTAEDQ